MNDRQTQPERVLVDGEPDQDEAPGDVDLSIPGLQDRPSDPQTGPTVTLLDIARRDVKVLGQMASVGVRTTDPHTPEHQLFELIASTARSMGRSL